MKTINLFWAFEWPRLKTDVVFVSSFTESKNWNHCLFWHIWKKKNVLQLTSVPLTRIFFLFKFTGKIKSITRNLHAQAQTEWDYGKWSVSLSAVAMSLIHPDLQVRMPYGFSIIRSLAGFAETSGFWHVICSCVDNGRCKLLLWWPIQPWKGGLGDPNIQYKARTNCLSNP